MIRGIIVSDPYVVKVNDTTLTQFMLLTDDERAYISVITYLDVDVNEGQQVCIGGDLRERRFIYNGEDDYIIEIVATFLSTKYDICQQMK